MLFERIFIWPIILISYGALFGASLQLISGELSGNILLGLLFAVSVGVPVFFGYAGYLWRKNLLLGAVRWEALICAVYPMLLLIVAGAFIMARKIDTLTF
jgi:hypothetical protein